MPTKGQWEKIYADLAKRLRLPCRLRFTDNPDIIGRHVLEDGGKIDGVRTTICYIDVNLANDWRVPEHLLLHEAAHHRMIEAFDWNYEVEQAHERSCWHGHCEHWARALCEMYAETGISLPRTTSFEEFAKAAGIEHRRFHKIGSNRIGAEQEVSKRKVQSMQKKDEVEREQRTNRSYFVR